MVTCHGAGKIMTTRWHMYDCRCDSSLASGAAGATPLADVCRQQAIFTLPERVCAGVGSLGTLDPVGGCMVDPFHERQRETAVLARSDRRLTPRPVKRPEWAGGYAEHIQCAVRDARMHSPGRAVRPEPP